MFVLRFGRCPALKERLRGERSQDGLSGGPYEWTEEEERGTERAQEHKTGSWEVTVVGLLGLDFPFS